MKKIITHTNPDLDAITAIWLLKKFLLGWEEAEVGFVIADQIKNPDADPDTLYTDVGRGKLDHHQKNNRSSATKLCYSYLKKQRSKRPLAKLDEQALNRLVVIVNDIDNAGDMFWPEAADDRYIFYSHSVIDGLRRLEKTDEETLSLGFILLDTILLNLKIKIRAEEELEQGIKFETPWGKAIALESGNRQLLWYGEVAGFVLVVTKDPEQGGVKIYARPDSKVDLSKAYKKFQKLDPDSDWYLHATKRLLLNQSSVNPTLRPTKLTLEKVIKVLKK